MSLDLSIVIVNWKSADYLRECLRSVYAYTHEIGYEIVVIDNASYDGSEAMVAAEFPGVVFIQSAENLGFAKANNCAYRRTAGEFRLFLNPDTEVTEGALAGMVAHLRNNPGAAIAGPCLLNTDGSIQISCVQAFPTITNQLLNSALLRRLFPRWRGWGMTALYSGDAEATAVDAVSGACLMIRRKDFENVGLFTEKYFMYFEDMDLSYKVAKAGRRVDYLPGCRVTHHGGKSSGKQLSHFASLQQKEAVLQFFRGARGALYCGVYRVAIAAAAAGRVCLALVLAPVWRGGDARNWRSAVGKWSAVFQWATGWKTLAS